MSEDLPPVRSYYRSNISETLLSAQRSVFAHLGIALDQCFDEQATHAEWLDKVFEEAKASDIVVVADIDAFPLSRAAYEHLIDSARRGAIAGLAQVANHKNPNKIYAGPMFIAVRASTWKELGRPSMRRTEQTDVAQSLTEAAIAAGQPVDLIYPRFAIQPKWPLAGHGVFGIGTFYGELEFFHLFQSRLDASVRLLDAVARDTIRGSFDFGNYLEIMSEELSPQNRRRRFRLF